MFVVWNPVFKFFVTPQLIHTDTEYIMLEQRFDKARWSIRKEKNNDLKQDGAEVDPNVETRPPDVLVLVHLDHHLIFPH